MGVLRTFAAAPRPRAGISGALDVLNEWLVLRQEDFPGRPGDLPARLAKYEKRVTTGGNQDNIGQMFIGKENRERESGKMANIHSDVGRETAADPSQQKTPDDFRPGFRDAARSEILNRFAHFRRSF